MATHMMCVRMAPLLPMSAPTVVSSGWLSMKPSAHRAHPEYELSTVMTTGEGRHTHEGGEAGGGARVCDEEPHAAECRHARRRVHLVAHGQLECAAVEVTVELAEGDEGAGGKLNGNLDS